MTLPTRTLGKNGPKVTAIGAGLMSLCHVYGHAGDDEARLAYLDALYEMGETNWDNADLYGDAEDLVGKWFTLHPERRKDIFLATKFGFLTGTIEIRSDPEYVQQACEKSLKRLSTDYIDLYYCHRVDGKTPIELTVGAMADLQRAGKIRHLGLSEVSASTLRRAHKTHPISAVQMEYSPWALDIESPTSPVLSTCKELGIALVAYAPLGRGFLTGQVSKPADVAGDFRATCPRFLPENFEVNLKLVRKVEQLAAAHPCTPSQLCLAWLMRQWEGVVPIPGTRSADRVRENVAALEVLLSDEEDRQIRELCEAAEVIGDRYPGVVLNDQLFGETPELKE